jgi:sugar lactone lactonase YvrE
MRIGDFTLTWGESLRWDDRRDRLWFVDCAAQTLHWLDGGEPPLHTMQLSSLPTGLALTEGDELVICLDGGLHVVDADRGTVELLAPYPDGMHGRANDADADGSGNLVTGTLNMAPGPGAYWWWSATDGWRLLDEGIGNANGPVVMDGTLWFADTIAASVFAYAYDGATGAVGARQVFDESTLGGVPDGAAGDVDGGYWGCVLNRGALARFTGEGLDRTVDVPVTYPSDIAFGGANLDRMFVVSIALDLGGGPPGDAAGQLLALDGVAVGRPESRVRLA